ncbi:Alpha/beta hydrolase family protein [Salinimicrobium catena]|uniref:Alpha/beta hydrolase family protein n=1 Tax=Salinimicrobium catena TaxID=390640 RepID=A0A1H5IW97_9FLAO|nr:alpha/beta hydrolase fold domain-containing protein [Salinimicrobium catena]SDK81438.1 Alpha/beta hydrolase family protein [Salinimicrobium catena]SEE44482.1 Alpha/beta hydrolase family protein [Salinimicrobium catena]
MVIIKQKNIPLPGKHGRPVITDVFFSEEGENKPVLIFCHGYKGFKDWGAWNLMGEEFARRGFLFIKFNFAFNGGTLEEPIDFPDLDAFGENTYTKELDDLEVLLDWLTSEDSPYSEVADVTNIGLMGHSRGGGVVLVRAAEDRRIKKLITLAAVSDFGDRFPKGKELDAWEQKGIAYIENTRTKQQMPHLFEFYEDFKRNEERLTISRAAKELHIPVLIIHGSADPTVSIQDAHDLHDWIADSQLFVLEGSDHVFEASHPWNQTHLSDALGRIVDRVTGFLE